MRRDQARLERECRTFTRLFSGLPANDYLLEKYFRAHERSDAFQVRDAFDARLLQAASGSPGLARLAGGYARLFFPLSALRKKLILTLALVEVTPPYSAAVAGAPARSKALTVAYLVLAGTRGVLGVLLGILVFGPLHVGMRLLGQRP
jgi:hypothetical protein